MADIFDIVELDQFSLCPTELNSFIRTRFNESNKYSVKSSISII